MYYDNVLFYCVLGRFGSFFLHWPKYSQTNFTPKSEGKTKGEIIMRETNGKVLEVFIGECFMFRADELLAPDLMEAHERYGIAIDDAFFTVQFFGGKGNEEEKQVIVYTGFFGENMHLQFLEPLPKEITQDTIRFHKRLTSLILFLQFTFVIWKLRS